MIHDVINLKTEDLELIATALGVKEEVNYEELKSALLNKIDADWGKYIEQYFSIKTPSDNKLVYTEFKFNEAQQSAVTAINKGVDVTEILKWRQEGITNLLAAFAVIKAVIKPRKVLIYCPTAQLKHDFFEKVSNFALQYAYNTPCAIVDRRILDSGVEFHNGSEIKIINHIETCRGLRADYIIVDEIGFVKNSAEVVDTLRCCLNDGGQFIFSNTVADHKRPKKSLFKRSTGKKK